MVEIWDVVNIFTLIPSILGGLITGSIIFNSFKIKFSDIYVMSITTFIFLFLVMTTELTRAQEDVPGIAHWMGVTVLYVIYILSAVIGMKFKRAALFLNLL